MLKIYIYKVLYGLKLDKLLKEMSYEDYKSENENQVTRCL